MAIKVNFSCTYTFFFVLRWHLPQAGPSSKLQLKNAAHTSVCSHFFYEKIGFAFLCHLHPHYYEQAPIVG